MRHFRGSDLSFTRDSFDFIYSLGVTIIGRRLSSPANWRFIADRLAPDDRYRSGEGRLARGDGG